MSRPATLGSLERRHRGRVGEILRATGVFREDEVVVALELVDEALESSADYELVGVFDVVGELAGYACFGPTPASDRTWDLYWIAVDPAAQGTGAGSLLLTEVERRLTGRHARMLVVETSSRSEYEPTRAFYARRGYAEAARVRGFYAPGDDRIILTKRFHAPGGGGVAA